MEKIHVFSTCICALSCVYMLFGCAYVTILVHELRDIRDQCNHVQDTLGDARDHLDATVDENIHMDPEETELDVEVLRVEHDVEEETDTFKHRLKRAVPDHLEEVPTRHKRKTKKPKKSKSKVKAGHYVTKVTDNYLKEHVTGFDDSDPFSITDPCTFIPELGGKLCRSRDFYVNNTEGAIRVFKPSKWTTKKLEPFILKENGEFQARYKGVYFVYAQVLFYDHYNMQSIVLNHKTVKKRKVLSEEHVLSCTTNGGGSDQRSLYNTCSIQGLVAMNKKDILTVVNLNQDVKLHFREPATYFGAFLLK